MASNDYFAPVKYVYVECSKCSTSVHVDWTNDVNKAKAMLPSFGWALVKGVPVCSSCLNTSQGVV